MSTSWQSKAGTIECQGEGYVWSQTRREVLITVPVESSIRGRDIECNFTSTKIEIKVKSKGTILQGKLFSTIKSDDSVWTLEDNGKEKTLEIELVKAEEHQLWCSVVEGKDTINPLIEEEIKKKMMLERFQGEHAGFDFSGADFT
eukprot:CAMPEP_0201485524 /NCGR_PEP_ID=MMETSP0151_2-20130828/9617_1 /ASSEMBLY_ACC=CAM_ASM_000257 /TAXON_ID=200890 /ORGANISM="Paramoeba atlantica, Strain 621/1 / CCAP 1560/9" /LENGTH=144 /DNA_ID=CAMNT_0047869689 /DNA_START=107 /DNA_END=537 /DNA_ORIENTATION=+